MGATTPSPYNYNRTRYRKVSNRAKKSGGAGCAVVALALVAAPVLAAAAGVTTYFV